MLCLLYNVRKGQSRAAVKADAMLACADAFTDIRRAKRGHRKRKFSVSLPGKRAEPGHRRYPASEYIYRRGKMKKRVLFIASECVPFIKTGGLADVVGSLPKYYDQEKYDVRVIIPNYRCISPEWKEKMNFVTSFYMDMAWRSQYVGIMELKHDGIQYYFIDNEYYLAGDRPYGNIHEDIEKFAYFSKAALSILPVVDFRPDIVHCHDWQTGLVPVYLKDSFHQGEFYANMKSIMTIHNLKFQGAWNIPTVQDATGLDMSYFTSDKLEAFGDANYLKGGIV